MRLIPLKRTLSHLEVSWNKRITDDSVPTLCALSNLNFLSLKQTSISMKGVRKLACAFKAQGKKISIILTFIVGGATTVTSIVRLVLLVPLLKDPDQTFGMTQAILWM